MPAETHRWTTAEVRDLQDESRPWPRYELIAGELLVTPAPRGAHQRAVGLLHTALANYLEAERLGEAVLSPADLELEPENITQPDVFVVPSTAGHLWRAWSSVGGRATTGPKSCAENSRGCRCGREHRSRSTCRAFSHASCATARRKPRPCSSRLAATQASA